ncbi:MAG: DUF1232 domain-containing protein [Halioglobus sp.]
MPEDNKFEVAYSEKGFWDKLKHYGKTAGREVVEKALLLFYAAQEEKAPAWAKGTIVAALGYFIMPLDAIADLTPAVGYADDLGVLVLAVAVVATYINDDVRSKTGKKYATGLATRSRRVSPGTDHSRGASSRRSHTSGIFLRAFARYSPWCLLISTIFCHRASRSASATSSAIARKRSLPSCTVTSGLACMFRYQTG